MARSDLVDIACKIMMDDPTRKAVAVSDGTTEKFEGQERVKWYWLPRSLTQINADGTVTVPEWLAIEKGLV